MTTSIPESGTSSRSPGGTADGTQAGPAQRVAAATGDAVRQAIAVMALLRSEEGCPWDREQTFDSIKRHTLEETYEVFDAIERRDWGDLRDELGDLLLQVLFYAQMAEEAGHFGMEEVAAGLVAKLIRRHPHVFGSGAAGGAVSEEAVAEAAVSGGAVLRNWEQIKRAEKKAKGLGGGGSLLAEIPRSMPALMEAGKLGSRAAKVGFDWPEAMGLIAKLREETEELEVEMARGREAEAAVAEEFGDLMFTAVNLARHLGVDPESALRAANAKFRERFAAMEMECGGAEPMERCTPEEMEAMWSRAKVATRAAALQRGTTA